MRGNTNNGEAGRDMAAPLPVNEVCPSKYWVLDFIFHALMVAVVGTAISIRDIFYFFFRQKKSVKGQVVVISGSGRGLGRSIALKMSRLGAKVACVDINTKNNEETVHLIRQEGGRAEAFTVNVAKSSQVDQFSKEVVNKLGPVDIVINNAGLVMPVPIDEITYDDIRVYCEVNLMSAMFMTKAFLPEMRKRNSGHIVAVSSMASFSPLPWLSLYCSTKSGLSRFMETLHVELNTDSGNKIKVTTAHPFFINTSADYFRFFKALTPILEEDTCADGIIDAVLYDKKSVCVPTILSMLQVINGVLPLHYFNLNIKYLGRSLKPPTKKEREELPYGRIVKQTTSDNSL